MGFQLEIEGYTHHIQDFQVQEAAMPLAAGDSSGQVGTLTVTVKAPDTNAFPAPALMRPTVLWNDPCDTTGRWGQATLANLPVSTNRYRSAPASIRVASVATQTVAWGNVPTANRVVPTGNVGSASVWVFLDHNDSLNNVWAQVTTTVGVISSPTVRIQSGRFVELRVDNIPASTVSRITIMRGGRNTVVFTGGLYVDDFRITYSTQRAYVGDRRVSMFGPHLLIGKEVRLTDTRKGFTLGRITAINKPVGSTYQLTCESRLGLLNVYGVNAKPYQGTLAGAFEYYLALAGVTSDLFVDPDIALTQVMFQGWTGELWFNLKQMATALEVDLLLVSGVIVLRPVRRIVASRGRAIDTSYDIGGQLAQAVEVYQYNNRPIVNELVYPPGGWTDEVTVINVDVGQQINETLELSASVTSVQQPTMVSFVGPRDNDASVYTVIGDDELPIQRTQWQDAGGFLEVTINPDSTSLNVRIQAPRRPIYNRDGNPIGVYSIALSAGSSGSRYSTLRILGSGIAFDKQLVRIPTGVPASRTGTDIGVSIDNPFLSTTSQVWKAGKRAARRYKGRTISMSASVVSLNRLGESGIATYPTYAQFRTTQAAARTYAQVKAIYAPRPYSEVKAELFESVQNDFENQVFGNVAGARVYDRETRRWYRVRDATLAQSRINIQADDDMVYSDIKGMWDRQPARTYGVAKEYLGGFSYGDVNLMGMFFDA